MTWKGYITGRTKDRTIFTVTTQEPHDIPNGPIILLPDDGTHVVVTVEYWEDLQETIRRLCASDD